MVARGYFPGVKWPEREAEHAPPTSAEVKNGRATSSPPIWSKETILSLPVALYVCETLLYLIKVLKTDLKWFVEMISIIIVPVRVIVGIRTCFVYTWMETWVRYF
jgi:hypothetical protein